MIYCSSFRIRFSPTFNISVRQYRKLHEPNPPKSLQDIEEVREKFKKTQEYGLDKAKFEFVSGLFGQIQSTWIIVWDVLPWLWNLTGEWLIYAGYGTDHEVFLISMFIGNLFSLYILGCNLRNRGLILVIYWSQTFIFLDYISTYICQTL